VNWIPCSERLPEPKWPVLFCIFTRANKYVAMGQRTVGMSDESIWLDTDTDRYGDNLEWYEAQVTHWMPLPEPPK
jgi:hypothetical protein